MSIHVHWFLPTTGDSREIVGFGPTTGPPAAGHRVPGPGGTGRRPAGLRSGAHPHGDVVRGRLAHHRGPEPGHHGTSSSWSPSVPVSSRPTLAAQQASTFQRITGGRLLLNIVTGGDADEQRRFGDWLDHDRRYDRTAEFITVLRGAWGAEPFDFHGEHYEIAGAPRPGHRDPFRRSSSAGRHRPPSGWPPAMPTST